MSTRARAGLGAAALAVGAAWILHPVGVPLYDGIGFPDEPYRYVSPPPDAKATKPVTSASDRSPVSGGTNKNLFFASSKEQGPQVTVAMPSKALSAPTATQIVLQAIPVAPTVQPQGARVDGNVYRVTWTADRGSITPNRTESLAYVVLRATTGRQPGPRMYRRADGKGPWQVLRTTRVGNDIYQSPLPGPGDYALAFSTTAKSGGGGFPTTPVVVSLVVILLAAIVVVAVRLRRRGET